MRGLPTISCAVPGRDRLGEAVVWCHRTRLVWWLDILAPALQSYDPARGAHRVVPLPAQSCGALALRQSGGLIVALDRGLHAFDPHSGALGFLLHLTGEPVGNRYNDACCDSAGRLWIGTMDAAEQRASGGLHRIDPDGSAQRHIDGLAIPNSLAFSPDGRTLYFADTPRHVIWAFDHDGATGTITRRRPFADLSARSGHPDGSCVDADGFLWNAEYGGGRLTRYAPDGRIDRIVHLPVSNPTCCAFGGDGLDMLFVTTASKGMSDAELAAEPLAGALLTFDPGVRGLPEAAFGG